MAQHSGSRPIRARGLKHEVGHAAHHAHDVAPHTGAWIETHLKCAAPQIPQVAPHTGAWIETPTVSWAAPDGMSRPIRARGLKLILSGPPS